MVCSKQTGVLSYDEKKNPPANYGTIARLIIKYLRDKLCRLFGLVRKLEKIYRLHSGNKIPGIKYAENARHYLNIYPIPRPTTMFLF